MRRGNGDDSLRMHGDPSFSKGFGKTAERAAPALIGHSVSGSAADPHRGSERDEQQPVASGPVGLLVMRREARSRILLMCAGATFSLQSSLAVILGFPPEESHRPRPVEIFPPRPESADPPVTPVRAPRNLPARTHAPPRDLQPTNHCQSRCPPSWAGRTIRGSPLDSTRFFGTL